MIRLSGVQQAYAGRGVFPAPLDLALPAGSVVGVVGASSVGKTTFLRLLAEEIRPSSGELTGAGSAASWVPQQLELALTLTALENVAVPLIAYGVGGHEAEDRARTALASVGLEDSADHLVEELSGGQQQRVAVARAFARESDLLLADEPTSALDAGNRHRVLELFRERARAGALVVVTATERESLGDVADQVIDLDAKSAG